MQILLWFTILFIILVVLEGKVTKMKELGREGIKDVFYNERIMPLLPFCLISVI